MKRLKLRSVRFLMAAVLVVGLLCAGFVRWYYARPPIIVRSKIWHGFTPITREEFISVDVQCPDEIGQSQLPQRRDLEPTWFGPDVGDARLQSFRAEVK